MITADTILIWEVKDGLESLEEEIYDREIVRQIVNELDTNEAQPISHPQIRKSLTSLKIQPHFLGQRLRYTFQILGPFIKADDQWFVKDYNTQERITNLIFKHRQLA